jgi:hypothetical protein
MEVLRIPKSATKILLPEVRLPEELQGGILLGGNRFQIPMHGVHGGVGKRRVRLSATHVGDYAVHIPPRAIKVNLPDLQQPDNHSCALCSMAICRWLGVGPDNFAEFKHHLGTTKDGTYYGRIVSYLNELGLDAFVHQNMTAKELMHWLDQGVPVILSIQAYAGDPSEYAKNGNGHYVVGIGHARLQVPVPVVRTPTARLSLSVQRSAKATAVKRKRVFFFMDPSIVCQRGYLCWDELDPRWHENEGTERKPEYSHHLGIIVRPNGHKPIHDTLPIHID